MNAEERAWDLSHDNTVRTDERRRIVARLRQLATERDRRIGTPEWQDAAEPARFLAGVATIIESEE